VAHRVLFVCETAQISGAEVVLLNLLSALDRSLYEPHAICGPEGPLAERLAALGVAVTQLRVPRPRRTLRSALRELPRLPGFSRRLGALLRERDIDLLHANSLGAHLACSRAAAECGIPAIWHMHDILRRRWPNGAILRRAAAAADRIICVSRAVADELERWRLPVTKLTVIHNGLDPQGRFRPRAATGFLHAQFGLPAHAQLAAIIGQVTPWKGQHVFLRAAGTIGRERPQAVFLVVGAPLFGGDGYRRRLERIARAAGIADRVVFTGRRSDVPEIMTEVEVVVHASVLPDSLPTVLLEAAASAKPVVATSGGGVAEIVVDGRTGLLVPPGDAEAMAAAIERLLDDPARAQAMGAAARTRAQAMFSLDDQVRKVQALYEEILGPGPSVGAWHAVPLQYRPGTGHRAGTGP
jgi:glycosyltransferase involved in cell wall biosynthesis